MVCDVGSGTRLGRLKDVTTFGDDEGMALGEWANVEKGESRRGKIWGLIEHERTYDRSVSTSLKLGISPLMILQKMHDASDLD